jgi:hypothetical protein
MQYFTPELFVRLQDLRDDGATAAWDRSVRDYASSLEPLLPGFPRELRQLAKGIVLHDADVLSITQQGDVLSVVVQPEEERGVLILAYTLVEAPRVERAVIPPPDCTEHAAWLYDELVLAEPVPGPPSWQTAQDRVRGDGRATVYAHDILLSNGWELLLKFRRFKLLRPQTLFPVPRPAEAEQEAALSRSA